MKNRSTNLLLAGVMSGACFALTACESSGGMRLAGVGAGTTAGSANGDTATTDTGSDAGATGSVGVGGSGSTGSGASAGTGAGGTATGEGSTGGGSASVQAADSLMVVAGNAVLAANERAAGVGSAIPVDQPITGTITRVIGDTGQALVDAGDGRTLLVDGLRGAVGDAVTVSAANRPVLASADGNPGAIGASIFSPTPATGTIAAASLSQAGLDVSAPAAVGALGRAQGALASPGSVVPGADGVVQANAGGTSIGGPSAVLGAGVAPTAPATGTVAAANVLPGGGTQVATVTTPGVESALAGGNNIVQANVTGTSVGAAPAPIGVGVAPTSAATGSVASVNVLPGGSTAPAATVSIPAASALVPR